MGPATDTIYDPYTSPKVVGDVAAAKEKRAQDTNATADQAPAGKTGKESQPAADPVVDNVRTLLEQGAMTVLSLIHISEPTRPY